MTLTKSQEKMKDEESNKNNIDKSYFKTVISIIGKSFRFLLFPKSRFEQFQTKDIKKIHRKKRSKTKKMLQSSITLIGVILTLSIISLSIFGSWIAPYSYEEVTSYSLYSWKPPTLEFPLGTGYAGRDVLSRIIYGTRTALVISVLSVSISLIVGIFLGILAGYYGKWVDSIIMRVMDIILSFPGIIFALAFLAILNSRIQNIVIILGVIGIPFYSRLVRSSVLKTRELDYVAAAKVSGANNWRIMFRHILPNSIQPIVISMSYDIGRLMIIVTTLAFLGFSDSRFINWGFDIYIARPRMWEAPWAAFWPSFMLLVSVIGFMIVGDGLRDVLDPKYQLAPK